jgi:molybdopterin molybdotransferase
MARSPLTPVDEALSAILSGVQSVQSVETIPLMQALGRVLAEDQRSEVDVPPCDNSAMDGYAVRAVDVVGDEVVLPISQRIPAGKMGGALAKGSAARIFTGAAIPLGADSVVMQEYTELLGDDSVRVVCDVKLGQHIRPQGQDIAVGSVVVNRGKRLRPQEIGLLASIGLTVVPVFKRISVAVLSTGDELVEPGQPLPAGQIYNSNRYTLSALLTALGCNVIDGGIVTDDLDTTIQQLQKVSEQADLIISTGGVSVGEEDYVKTAVESLGELKLWKLNIKPGKPLAFGSVAGKPFFGLPGNPSSVFVTFSIVARPFLLKLQGQLDVNPVISCVTAGFEWKRAGSRQEYLRCRVESGVVSLYENQSSGVLASASWANALVILPPETTVDRGDDVEVILLSELISG